MKYMFYIVVIWNIITFFQMCFDKYFSKHNMWRIKERTLIMSAFLFGGVGSFLGMQFFRHKTKHLNFKILIPLALLINLIIFYFIFKEVILNEEHLGFFRGYI